MKMSLENICMGHEAKQLTQLQIETLRKDTCVTSFKSNKYEREAKRNWDLFYKRNKTNFFKDRNWTKEELTRLCKDLDFKQSLTILECGCGVGNFIYPFLNEFPSWKAFACDFSQRADHKDYDPNRLTVFECDLTECEDPQSLTAQVPLDSIDLCTLVFVLSAIHPDKMACVVQNIYKVLKVGGIVLVRDYGQYDHAMLRFAPGHKLADNFYVRQDGTRAYYFTKEYLTSLFSQFESLHCEYLKRQTVNLKEDICVDRVFVQATFIKPELDTSQV